MVDVGAWLTAREAAYLAVLGSIRDENFAHDYLERWRRESHPTPQDYRLAQEIAFGSIRMALALDYLATQLTDNKRLSLKAKEKALVRTAVYQHYYMTKIPLYALVNESVTIAKKYCHSFFAGFLNAMLRQMAETPFALPTGDSYEALSIHYSYPQFFIQQLVKDYSLAQAKEIMEAGNKPAPTMYRIRTGDELIMEVLKDSTNLAQIAESPEYYIQNATSAELIWKLKKSHRTREPKTILDLCAAPGGKLLAMHDCYPKALLFANDVSEHKVRLLRENCKKFGIQATCTVSKGEEYESKEKFDIVILDVPCSNSGVLNKRAEARWRLSEVSLMELHKTQKGLFTHAKTLLAPAGEIWFLTCSILKKENEGLSHWAADALDLNLISQDTHLPDKGGHDGGYGAILRHT